MINFLMICVGILFFYGCSKNPEEGKKLQQSALNAEAVRYGNSRIAMEAIGRAAQNNKYLFLFFYNKDDETCKKMAYVIENAKSNLLSRADFYSVDVADSGEAEVIKKYNVSLANLPLTIAIAPNGAITAGFPKVVTEEELKNAFVSQGTEKVIKVVQEGKLALVCFQNKNTKNRKQALIAAEGLAKDKQFNGAVEIIELDPKDEKEKSLVETCQVKSSNTATIVFLIPPGRIIGKFDSERISKDALMTTLVRSISSCGSSGSSCSPKGCR